MTAVRDDNEDVLLLPTSPTKATGIVNFILTSLPLSVIYKLRDIGIINILNDILAALIGLGVVVTRPSILYSFLLLTSRMRTIKYGKSNTHYFQVFDSINIDKLSNEETKAVHIFVHGGAWGSGKPWMYRVISDGLSQILECHHTIVIGYPVYPYANIYEQSESIYDAVKYIKEHECEIFRKKNYYTVVSKRHEYKYILCGHSSGANICSMAIMNSIGNRDKKKLVDTFVGLSGVYDIEKHYTWESGRGVQEISPMKPAALGIENFHMCSPTKLLEQNLMIVFDSNKLSAEKVNKVSYEEEVKKLFPETLLLHGNADDVVPYTSTLEFSNELHKKNVANKVTLFQGDHAAPIIDTMLAKETIFKKRLLNSYISIKKANIC